MADNNKGKKTPVDEGTAAAATLGAGPSSKSDMMTNVVTQMAGMSHSDLTDWFTDAMALIGKEARNIPDGAADSNKASIAAKPSGASDAMLTMPLRTVQIVKEDLAAVLGEGEGALSEEAVAKALVLFEAAVNARVAIEVVRLEEAKDVEVATVAESLAATLDEYLDYAAKEFVKENEVAIASSIRLEICESFMAGVRALYKEHNVAEDEVGVVEDLGEQITEMETRYNEVVAQHLETQKQLQALLATRAFGEVAEGLTKVDTEKLKTLVESFEFDGDVDAFKSKIKLVREANFDKKKPVAGGAKPLTEEVTVPGEAVVNEEGEVEVTLDPTIARYVDALNRHAPPR